MSGPLNQQPLGLLSLFDVKSGGRYPSELGEQISPTLDMLKWMSSAACTEVLTWTQAIAAAGNFTTTLVTPSSEIWLIDRIGCVLSMAERIELRASVELWNGITAPFANQMALSPETYFPVLVAGGAPVRLRPLVVTNPYILTPGSTIRFLVQFLALGGAADFTANVSIRFRRLVA